MDIEAADANCYDPTDTKLLTFHDHVPRFMDGSDTPRAYLERCLETIDEREPAVRAFVRLNVEGARTAADESTKRYHDGRPRSRVDGMPFGVKDLYETADMPTQMGSPLFEDWHTNRDCATVYGLRGAGAVVLGKTVTTEFGFRNPGPTQNPFDLTRTPGGSSSGSAAAVGARMVPVAIGSQVVGSLIRPASYCANFCFKPTLGALNRSGGHSNLSQSVMGMLAGCLTDAWIAAFEAANFAGGDPGHPGLFGDAELAPATKPTVLARLDTAGWSQCDSQVREKFERAMDLLTEKGATIVSKSNDRQVAEFEETLQSATAVTADICGYELRWPIKAYRDRGPNAISESISRLLAGWETLTAEDYHLALTRRESMRQQHAALKGSISAFITLAAPGAAPIGLESTGDPVFAVPSSLLGAPSLSVPVLEVEGMPLGIQIIGYTHDDAAAFGAARWILEAFGHKSPAGNELFDFKALRSFV